MRATTLSLAVSVAALSAPVSAQSLYSSAGVGLPVEALDGRARALGSLGIGLQGAALLPTDPAAAARLLLPSGVLAAAPSWVELQEQGVDERHYFRGTRFPLLGMAYPVYGGMATLQLTSFLDQRFQGERTVTVDLDGTPVPATDAFNQDGSVSTLNLGYARRVGTSTSVGLTIGRYAGTVVRSLVRDFGDSTSVGQVRPYLSSGSWRYSGELITGGVDTELLGAVRIAGSVTWSTALGANATGATEGADRSFDMPLQLRIGASAILAPGLSISASAKRADWSGTAADLGGDIETGSAMGFGFGLELSQVGLFGRDVPVRLGFRKVGIPFSPDGESATEKVFSGGLALTLNQTNDIVLASSDLAIEKGRRSGGDFAENFWRGTVSLKISGF